MTIGGKRSKNQRKSVGDDRKSAGKSKRKKEIKEHWGGGGGGGGGCLTGFISKKTWSKKRIL